MKILIVDDSNTIRRSIAYYLKDLNIEIIGSTASMIDARELFQTHLPDLVTLDITLPEGSGLDLLDDLMLINPNAKVIIVSAQAGKETALDARARGAAHFMHKPFPGEELVSIAKEILSGVSA